MLTLQISSILGRRHPLRRFQRPIHARDTAQVVQASSEDHRMVDRHLEPDRQCGLDAERKLWVLLGKLVRLSEQLESPVGFSRVSYRIDAVVVSNLILQR